MENQDMLVKNLIVFKKENNLKAIILQETSSSYAAKGGDGRIQKLMLCDEEGGRIQAVLFNEAICKFKKMIKPLSTIIIENAIVKTPNSKFPSINKFMELSFGSNTNVKAADQEISITSLMSSFISFKQVEHETDEKTFFDIIGVLHEIRPIMQAETFVRREATVINEELIPMTFTLWDNHARTTGSKLEQLKGENPIIAFMNITSKNYLGVPQLNVNAASSIFINPTCTRADELKEWCEPFSTYPRIYDLLHLHGLFTAESRCYVNHSLQGLNFIEFISFCR